MAPPQPSATDAQTAAGPVHMFGVRLPRRARGTPDMAPWATRPPRPGTRPSRLRRRIAPLGLLIATPSRSTHFAAERSDRMCPVPQAHPNLPTLPPAYCMRARCTRARDGRLRATRVPLSAHDWLCARMLMCTLRPRRPAATPPRGRHSVEREHLGAVPGLGLAPELQVHGEIGHHRVYGRPSDAAEGPAPVSARSG